MKKKADSKTSEITVRATLTMAVACAPVGTTRAQVVAAANAQEPTLNGWKVSKQRKLEDGTKLPAPCLDDNKRRHWLLEC